MEFSQLSEIYKYDHTFVTPQGDVEPSFVTNSQLGNITPRSSQLSDDWDRDVGTMSSLSSTLVNSDLQVPTPRFSWDQDQSEPLDTLENTYSSIKGNPLGNNSCLSPNLNLKPFAKSVTNGKTFNVVSSNVKNVQSSNKPAKIVVHKVSKISEYSDNSENLSGVSNVIRLPNRRQFPAPPLLAVSWRIRPISLRGLWLNTFCLDTPPSNFS